MNRCLRFLKVIQTFYILRVFTHVVSIYANLLEKNESIHIRREFNSHRIFLRNQNGRRFITLEHQHGCRDVMWKRSDPYFTWTPTSGVSANTSAIVLLLNSGSWNPAPRSLSFTASRVISFTSSLPRTVDWSLFFTAEYSSPGCFSESIVLVITSVSTCSSKRISALRFS